MSVQDLSPKKTSATYKIHKTRDVSAIMAKVHSRDTAVELRLRKALRERGIRYRLCQAKLPGKPDIVLTSKKIAIFIDGDYWHGGQWYRRNLSSLEDQFRVSDSKKLEYWTKKIRKNMDRDADSTGALLSEGWRVIRFWESDIDKNIEGCIQIIIDAANNGYQPASSALLSQKTFAELFAGIGLMRMGLVSCNRNFCRNPWGRTACTLKTGKYKGRIINLSMNSPYSCIKRKGMLPFLL